MVIVVENYVQMLNAIAFTLSIKYNALWFEYLAKQAKACGAKL